MRLMRINVVIPEVRRYAARFDCSRRRARLAQPQPHRWPASSTLISDLRTLVGDDRRVLVGFHCGGWSPEFFADLHAADSTP
jgi:hypothetical protein